MTWHFDLNAFIMIVFNLVLYGAAYLKNRQKNAIKDGKIKMMWADYKQIHKIKENGDHDG